MGNSNQIYVHKLGNRKFDTVDQYAKDFLSFIEGSTSLFPVEDQKNYARQAIAGVWSGLYQNTLMQKTGENPNISEKEKLAVLADIIRDDHQIWDSRYDDLDGFGLDFGIAVAKSYEDIIEQVEKTVFGDLKLTKALKMNLRKSVSFMFGKEWFHPMADSGLVIAGMGENEPFPSLLQYRVGAITAGRLRYAKNSEARVGAAEAFVVPFAQRDTIDMIIEGMHRELRTKLMNDFDQWYPSAEQEQKSKNAAHVDPKKEFSEYLSNAISTRYEGPFMAAVAALPRQDLAKMAESLVNLTAFLMRMTADQHETVAGPIDVAVLSKGDGFIWVKRKDLLASHTF